MPTSRAADKGASFRTDPAASEIGGKLVDNEGVIIWTPGVYFRRCRRALPENSPVLHFLHSEKGENHAR